MTAPRPRPPAVLDGEVLGVRDEDAGTHPPDSSPLLGSGLVWCGPFTAQDVADIAARAAYARLPWWQRWTTRAPRGWR